MILEIPTLLLSQDYTSDPLSNNPERGDYSNLSSIQLHADCEQRRIQCRFGNVLQTSFDNSRQHILMPDYLKTLDAKRLKRSKRKENKGSDHISKSTKK